MTIILVLVHSDVVYVIRMFGPGRIEGYYSNASSGSSSSSSSSSSSNGSSIIERGSVRHAAGHRQDIPNPLT